MRRDKKGVWTGCEEGWGQGCGQVVRRGVKGVWRGMCGGMDDRGMERAKSTTIRYEIFYFRIISSLPPDSNKIHPPTPFPPNVM